jgi:hypothetical protein
MKKKFLLLLTIGLISFVAFSSCTNNSDRYELVLSSQNDYTRTMLVDKKEGTVWEFYNGRWENVGTPPQTAPQQGDTFKVY